MTEDEMLIRAREACAEQYGESNMANEYRSGVCDHAWDTRCALRALRDLDKPVPDPWAEAATAFEAAYFTKSASIRVSTIAGLKAAHPLMPKEG